MTVTKLTWDKDTRFLRIGFGKNEGRWFARIDLWVVGFRVTR